MLKSKITLLLLLSQLNGCSLPFFEKYQTPFSVRNPAIEGSFETGNKTVTTMINESAQRWVDSYRDLKANPVSAPAIYTYIDSGITYSNLLCESYFSKLKFTYAHRDFARREVSLAGGLSSALMGLAKVSAGSIAATGALFGFGNASFDAYDGAFIFAADLSTLESLVKQRQKQQEVIIFKKLAKANGDRYPNVIITLEQAARELDGYIYTCTRGGIVTLLNETVTQKSAAVRESTKNSIIDSSTKAGVLENQPIGGSSY